MKTLFKSLLLKIPAYRKRIEAKELAEAKLKAKAEIQAARRAIKGRICHAKIMARLKDRGKLAQARRKRQMRRERNANNLGKITPRFLGTIVDESAFDEEFIHSRRMNGFLPAFVFIPEKEPC